MNPALSSQYKNVLEFQTKKEASTKTSPEELYRFPRCSVKLSSSFPYRTVQIVLFIEKKAQRVVTPNINFV